MNAKDMASLFDVDLESSLDSEVSSDYETTAGESQTGQSFDKRVEDAKRTLEPEPETDPETEIITQARDDAKKTKPRKVIKEVEPDLGNPEAKPPTEEMIAEAEAEASEAMVGDDEEMEIPGDVLVEVDADIARAAADAEQILSESDESDSEEEKAEAKEEAPISETVSDPSSPALEEDDNPLELSGDYLRTYQAIRKKYPQFVLYDGSRAYKGFYRFKVMVLSNILREFPILDIDDMFSELSEINLRQFVNADEVTPDVVRSRIDDVYRQKVRLADIMMQCYHQFFVWERELEMLKSKLWKDHELKGSHRRDGLTLEHLFDLEQYYNKLKGFMEAAKTADATLRAASDSLSRQLTCLQMKEQISVSYGHDSPAEPVKAAMATPKPRVQKSQQEPDVISDGSVITAPQAGGAAHPVDYGVDQSDDIAAL